MNDRMASVIRWFADLPAWAQWTLPFCIFIAFSCLFGLLLARFLRDPEEWRGEHRMPADPTEWIRTPSGGYMAVNAQHRAVDLEGHTQQVRWVAQVPPPNYGRTGPMDEDVKAWGSHPQWRDARKGKGRG